MNRSYSKIRHIQESNLKLENRLLNEQPGVNGMAKAISSVVKSTQDVYKNYPQYHDNTGKMKDELGKMEKYVMDVWRKEDGGNSFALETDSTPDTHFLTNGGRKVVWNFKQNKILFEKDFKFDPNPLPLNSNFNTFKSWFDNNNQQSDVSDLGWMAKSMAKKGLGLK